MIRRALVLILLSLGGLSCVPVEDCRLIYQCGSDPDYVEPTCDPSVGGINSQCAGVYVSSSRGSDENPGTPDRPMGTLSAALEAARGGARRVYACAETFAESVTIPSGIEVWGGLDCGGGWSYLGETAKTTIKPEPDAIPLRFVAGDGRAAIADVRAEAASAAKPGGSSIATLIGAGAAVDIIRSELVAGNGAAGTDGRTGGTPPASAGAPGSSGGDACTTMTVQGGAGGQTTCGGLSSAGGSGGIGGTAEGGDGTNGTPEPQSNPTGSGLGGAGQSGGNACTEGFEGADGADGAHGEGAHHSWLVSEQGWVGDAGQDGGDGRPGQGGGGGGGSRAGSMVCGSALGGASGGGGGAGGCGGAGGRGGTAGGSSIGVLDLSGDVTIRETLIRTGRGGDGGNGGLGQAGGARGPGGPGGIRVGFSDNGCPGGRGGFGGDGGNGGGGVGGLSLGILYQQGHAPLQDADIRTGEAGRGGLGGDPGVSGSAGEDGISADTMGVPR